MERVYNFSAGPSMLPLPVLEKIQKELVCYGNSGMSVMEMSHRSKVFEEIIQGAEKLLRELMDIPDNYKVMFLQGGGSTQFAMIPMNLFKNKKADFVKTGQWAKKAIEEASKLQRTLSLPQRIKPILTFPFFTKRIFLKTLIIST